MIPWYLIPGTIYDVVLAFNTQLELSLKTFFKLKKKINLINFNIYRYHSCACDFQLLRKMGETLVRFAGAVTFNPEEVVSVQGHYDFNLRND